MSKTLRRPMFKMGGNTDSGIISGFEREKFDEGTKSPEEQLAELAASVRQGSADAFATPPAYTQPGFGLSEYLALAKLGANIASAPNRGGGFKGFAASTAPAFGQFAEDLDVLNRQKMQTRAAFDAAGREAKLKAEGTAASLTAEGIVQKMSEAANLAEIAAQGEEDRKTNAAKLIEADKVFNKLEEVEAAYAENSAKITALDPLSTTFQDDLKQLQINEKSLIMQIFYLLDQDMPEDAVIEGLPLTAIKEEANVLGEKGLEGVAHVFVNRADAEGYKVFGNSLIDELLKRTYTKDKIFQLFDYNTFGGADYWFSYCGNRILF